MNSGAITGNGSSNCVSSNAPGSKGGRAGLISGRIRFQEIRILPRFNPCSSSSGGRATVASESSAHACLMASGQEPASWDRETTNGSMGSGGAVGAGGAGIGIGADRAGAAGLVCGLTAEGAGSGEEGLIGCNGNGAIGLMGA